MFPKSAMCSERFLGQHTSAFFICSLLTSQNARCHVIKLIFFVNLALKKNHKLYWGPPVGCPNSRVRSLFVFSCFAKNLVILFHRGAWLDAPSISQIWPLQRWKNGHTSNTHRRTIYHPCAIPAEDFFSVFPVLHRNVGAGAGQK